MVGVNQVLEDVTETEFEMMMKMLISLPSMNTLVGRQQLLELVMKQAELAEPFEVCCWTGIMEGLIIGRGGR